MNTKRKILLILAIALTFAALFAITTIGTFAAEGDVVTEYGTVPANKITSTTSVAVFAKTGEDANGNPTYKFLETGDNFIDNGIDKARQYLINNATYKNGTIVVYLLKDTENKRGSGWNAGYNLAGTVIVDLGNHTLTNRDPRLIGFEAKNDTKNLDDTNIEFKNGTIATSQQIFRIYGNSSVFEKDATKKITVNFNNVTFNTYNNSTSDFTMFVSDGTYSNTKKAEFTVNLNQCTFNYTGFNKLTLLNEQSEAGTVACTVNINGGDLNVNSISASTTNDTTSAEDNINITIDNYGTITKSGLTSDKHYALFAKTSTDENYTFVATYGGYSSGALQNALNNYKGTYKNGSVVVYMYTNVNSTSNAWNRAFQIDGTITLDLGTNTLTSSNGTRFIGFEAEGYTCESTVKIKNGTFCSSNPLVEIFDNNEAANYTGTKQCNLLLENVTFKPNGNDFNMIVARGQFASGQDANLYVEFKDCTLDYADRTTHTIINDTTAEGTVSCELKIIGGTIKAKSADALVLLNGTTAEDSYIFAKSSSNTATKFTFNYTANAPTKTFNTTDGQMHLAPVSTTDKTTTTYEFTNVNTKYGYIPSSAKDTTFLIFYNNLYLDSRGSYKNALDRARSLMSATTGKFKGEELTILLNKTNYTYNHTDDIYQNLAQIDGTVVIDLNGCTIKQTKNYIIDAVGKGFDGTLATTSIKIMNGTILTTDHSVVRITAPDGGSNFKYTGTKNYVLTFTDVTFNKANEATDYVPVISSTSYVDNNDGNKKMHVEAVFENCNFYSDDSLLFDFSVSELLTSNVTVKGGSLTSSRMGVHDLMIKASDKNTLTFDMLNGEYMKLTLPKYATTPGATFNNGELEFVRISETSDTVTFTLAEAGLNSFAPKTSITLDSNLKMNVYIPTDKTLRFTLGDESYTDLSALASSIVTIDGKTYYHIQLNLDPKRAASDVTLSVTVNYKGAEATGRFTFSIPKYANAVLETGADIEKQIIRDVLSYVRAAYNYFGTDSDGIVAKIDALIGADYDETAPYEAEGSTEKPSTGLISATFALDSTPALKFYIPTDADATRYTFYIGDKKLSTKTGTDTVGKYIMMNVYAYSMCETVTYYVDGVNSGSFHIAAYHAWANTQNNEKLTTLVERFWKYCQSARDYKNNVVNTVINYVDDQGNKLASSRYITSTKGDSFKLLSPSIDGYYTRDVYYSFTTTQSSTVDIVYKQIPKNIDANTVKELIDIAAWGDSITMGSNAHNLTSANKYGIDLEALGSTASGGTYAEILENLISKYLYDGVDVANSGVGGESTATIASRANTDEYYLALGATTTFGADPIIIPINQIGVQPNTTTNRVGFLRYADSTGSICNVTITDTNGNTITGIVSCKVSASIPSTEEKKELWNCNYKYLEYTFTRTDGKTDSITINEGARVITRGSVEYDGRTCIIFMGENGGFNNDVNELIKEQKAILKACGIDYKNGNNRYLIISSTSGSYESRTTIRNALKAEWGDHYINMGDVLNSFEAHKFVGYTEEDIAPYAEDIALGKVTPLLLADNCHPNAVGYTVIANTIFERLFDLGLFDELFDYYDSLNA